MFRITRHIPNTLTSFNLLCGVIAIAMAMDHTTIIYSPYLIFLGGIFDFLDGMAARALKAYSAIGKQLDSLADLVTFGVAPAILALSVMKRCFLKEDIMVVFNGLTILQYSLLFVCLLIPVFSALRLAKFNIDETQSDSFRGLPTPASAFLLSSIILAYFSFNQSIVGIISNAPFIFVLVILIDCFLMVSNIRMLSLKFKNFSVAQNWSRYLLVIVGVSFFIVWKLESLAFTILFYVLLSIILNFFKKKEN